MLDPAALDKEDILAIDRGYIDYERFEELTKKGSRLWHEDEEKPQIYHTLRHDVPDPGRTYGGPYTTCNLY